MVTRERMVLGRLASLSELGEDELDRLAAIARPRRLRAGDVVMEKEDAAGHAYLLITGMCKVVAPGPGRETTLDVFGPGEFLGELALLDGGVRSARVQAIRSTELLSFERAALLRLLDTCPGLSRLLLRIMARRLRRLTETVESITGQGVRPRLARKLVDLARRQGSFTPDGVRIDLLVPQEELGRMIGAVRESVNKYIREFRGAGYITMDGNHLVVVNQKALADLAAV